MNKKSRRCYTFNKTALGGNSTNNSLNYYFKITLKSNFNPVFNLTGNYILSFVYSLCIRMSNVMTHTSYFESEIIQNNKT